MFYASSPSAVYFLWGKMFYKVDTLPNVSLGYVDHVEKIPHFFHTGKLRFQALFHNDASAIWQKINISKYRPMYITYACEMTKRRVE